MEYDEGELMYIHPFALGIGAASFAERSGAKIERKARRAAERHKKSTDYSQRTTDFGFKAESLVFAINPAASEKSREEILTLSG